MNAYQFFYRNAGFSYDPKTQTQAQGKRECAKELARAEKWASRYGVTYYWVRDSPTEIQEEDGTWKEHEAVYCLARDGEGKLVGSLFGITESGDALTRANYRRVVEAELALEAMEHR